MAKYVGYKRPKDTKKTIRHLLVYLGMHKWSFLLVALLVLISAGANITGTYLLKPVINRFIVPGDLNGLVRAVSVRRAGNARIQPFNGEDLAESHP